MTDKSVTVIDAQALTSEAHTAPVRHAGGRPSKYRPEYCEGIVEKMSRGFSAMAYAGSIRVSRQTIYQWAETVPEFNDALKEGISARVHFLEDGLLSPENGTHLTSRIFALKNASPQDWRERYDPETAVGITVVLPKDVLAGL
jgi:hypothetical protein